MLFKAMTWLGCFVLSTTLGIAQDNSITGDLQETPPSAESEENLAGIWYVQFESPFGLQIYQLEVLTGDQKPSVTGVVQSEQPKRNVEFRDVKLDGQKISFTEVRQFGEREMRIEYSGQLVNQNLVLNRSFGERGGQEAIASRQRPRPVAEANPQPLVEVKIDQVIKEAFKSSFLIGTAGDLPNRYSIEEQKVAAEHFGAITPENCMKPERIHPHEDRWQFETSDALVEWAQTNNLSVHGHTLVWHAQTPNWFFEGGDKEVVQQRMKEHILTLAGRYRGKLQSWDVVNEAINDGGNAATAKTENLRNSKWKQTLGPEFLTLAFKFAHEADPEAVLYYNDYNIESGPKHSSSMVLLKRLLDEGAPVHGVGIQGHWRTGQVPYDDIDKAISDYASLGLKVSITELDVTIRGESGGQFGRGFGRGRTRTPITADDLNEQADAYAKLWAIFKKHEDVIERITFWGLNDRRTWRWGQHPLILDANNYPKPAYAAIVNLRENEDSKDEPAPSNQPGKNFP